MFSVYIRSGRSGVFRAQRVVAGELQDFPGSAGRCRGYSDRVPWDILQTLYAVGRCNHRYSGCHGLDDLGFDAAAMKNGEEGDIHVPENFIDIEDKILESNETPISGRKFPRQPLYSLANHMDPEIRHFILKERQYGIEDKYSGSFVWGVIVCTEKQNSKKIRFPGCMIVYFRVDDMGNVFGISRKP